MDLNHFLELHPWAAGHAGEKLEFFWQFDLNARASEIWPFVTDTSRLNRAIGWPEMKFTEREGQLYVDSTVGGMAQSWREVPWDWNYCRDMVCVREYIKGLAKVMRGILHVEDKPDSDSVHVIVYFGWIPRTRLARRILAETFPSYEAKYERVLKGVAEHSRQARDITEFKAEPTHILPEAGE